MEYSSDLIRFSYRVETSDTMYSLILLSTRALSLTVNGVKCWLDGHYVMCLCAEDAVKVVRGGYEAYDLQFLPRFYNVGLSDDVIKAPEYADMREKFGYPDFHLFRTRDESYCGIIPVTGQEYDSIRLSFLSAFRHIEDHETDELWSCRARSDVISILRIAESAYAGEHGGSDDEIVRYIRDNIGEPMSLGSLCRRFHVNRTTLAERIRNATGMSPMEYVREERLNQSRPDLLFTSIPVSEIALRYGFTDANYYIRAFKKRFGKPPLRYRTDGLAERIRDERLRGMNSKINPHN